MQLSTLVLLVCLVAVAASAYAPAYDAVNLDDYTAVHQAEEVPVHDRSSRTKRFIFLKKKLLLGALGLKAVKAAKIGAVGVAGALALKKVKGAAVASHASGGASYGGGYSYSSYGK